MGSGTESGVAEKSHMENEENHLLGGSQKRAGKDLPMLLVRFYGVIPRYRNDLRLQEAIAGMSR